MVKVLYGTKTNAILGGVMFHEGVAEFDNDAEGILFAEMFHRKYEIITKAPAKKKADKVEEAPAEEPVKKPKRTAKKKVNANE